MNTKELDVVDFQKAVEIAYGERLAFLQEELIRVRDISDHCKDWFERYYSWQPPTNSSTIDASGKGHVLIRDDRSERELYAFGKRMRVIRVASSAREVNTKDLFPEREKNLEHFITKAGKYLSGASSFMLPHAVVQYAVDKFEIRDWTGTESLARAYSACWLSPAEQATFLLDLKSTDKKLSSRLLSILSRISGTTSVYQAVWDGNFDGLVKLLSSSEPACLVCAQEVSSWRNALSVSDIRNLDALIKALQSIQENFFLRPIIPVLDNLDGHIWTILYYTDWPENTWGDKEQVEEIVKSIATRQGESGTAGVPNNKPIEDSSIRFDYKEPEPDEEGHYPYLPGLKAKLHDLKLIGKIIQNSIDFGLFDDGDKEQVEEIVKSIATRQGESGTAGVPNNKPIEDSSIRFDYKEPEPDEEGHYPYLPGLKAKLHDLKLIGKIIQNSIDFGLFDDGDKDILLYAFTGQNSQECSFQGRRIRLKDRFAEGGKNNGKVTYPYEFVYLLLHMFKNEKVIFKLSTLYNIFSAEPDTWMKLQDIFYDDKKQSMKGKNGPKQIAQSAKADFQEKMNEVMRDVFPVKRK